MEIGAIISLIIVSVALIGSFGIAFLQKPEAN